jgi:hypothetical protein
MKRPISIAVLLALAVRTPLSHAAAPEGIEISVSASASDGDGSAARPFATLAQAAAALAKRSPAERSEPASIVIHAGTYPVAQPVVVTAAEAGSTGAPVTWRAAGDGDVIVSGGIAIPDAAVRAVTDPVTLGRLPARDDPSLALFEIRLADLGLTEFPKLTGRGKDTSATGWPELFRGGVPLPLSAWPNTPGYSGGFKPAKILSGAHSDAADGGGANDAMSFVVANDRVERWRSAIDAFHADVWIGGHWYWSWADDFLPVASIGQGGVVTMGQRHHYGIGRDVDLHVYNLAEEMDRADEYALEPAARRILVLLPKDGPHGGMMLSWSAGALMRVRSCGHVRFESIRFTAGRGDGVDVEDGSDVAFSRCAFTDLGRDGLAVSGRRVEVTDCAFDQIGAVGASISGGDRKTLAPSGNTVGHCTFTAFGRLKRTYAPAVSLAGVGATVEHCLMSGAPHAAILFSGNEHLIRDNEIRAVLSETGDCGAIYGGRDWTACGTRISGNWIHDLGGLPGQWPCGIYLDDELSGITVEGNLIERAVLGILVGGGRYNDVRGNVIVGCAQGLHLDSRGTSRANNMATLRERLAAVPVNDEPWRSRYPMLARTLTDDPEKPVGTRVVGNAVVGCQKQWRQRVTSGVAVVDPNWVSLPPDAIAVTGRHVDVRGTTLTFDRPDVGVRP